MTAWRIVSRRIVQSHVSVCVHYSASAYIFNVESFWISEMTHGEGDFWRKPRDIIGISTALTNGPQRFHRFSEPSDKLMCIISIRQTRVHCEHEHARLSINHEMPTIVALQQI